uniref:ATP-dependent DNA helicase n=2 Tax=Anthurium amnicola TaxID=1678845 RepID=A0A1D1ZDN4_9ARAE
MDGNDTSADYVIAELIDMGFEFSKAKHAVETAGPCLDAAVDFILTASNYETQGVTQGCILSDINCSASEICLPGKKVMPVHNIHRLKQSCITDHLPLSHSARTSSYGSVSETIISQTKSPGSGSEEHKKHSNGILESAPVLPAENIHSEVHHGMLEASRDRGSLTLKDLYWDEKTHAVLEKHFGLSSLKNFQKEALEAWCAHRDCLVLAATGSGKSLCFQLPALLSGQVVVVISPLISLMRDQCLKLATYGVSACFLGSGQSDSSVEKKAMSGVYDLIYVCPETVLRLVDPLRRLAENRGIALFAIDEAHCVSKWGHDFRPDYRRLSVLRENFKACNLKSLKFDIPLMALTATATVPVRQDIIQSLLMSEETQIILTSFFRPNLRFSVKHSRTSSTSSYHRDFSELIKTYTMTRVKGKGQADIVLHGTAEDYFSSFEPVDSRESDADEASPEEHEDYKDTCSDSSAAEIRSADRDALFSSGGEQMTVEFLEDELDIHQNFDDLDVSCGEFCGDSPNERQELCPPSGPLAESGGELQGPTIVYVPTRKETLKIAEFLCKFGVKAAAYHAMLPRSHLSRVHEEFHHNTLEVVVATVAFGMGIDKSNVRRIIHYGWPQSLEAYYQEAGRAGRDGKPSDCILYANLSRVPTLLPSKRSEQQKMHAYKMLSDCFRYGMNTASCRTKMLVSYFGEDFRRDKCHLCDVCVNGPPELQNMGEEAKAFLQVLAALCGRRNGVLLSQNSEQPNLRMVISRIREKFEIFSSNQRLWWQGLARILKDKGYMMERDGVVRIGMKYPEPTDLGMELLQSDADHVLYAYPEADMLISRREQEPYSTFSEWGRGWADPEIRERRLQRLRNGTRKRKRCPRRKNSDLNTVRGRISAKLWKHASK